MMSAGGQSYREKEKLAGAGRGRDGDMEGSDGQRMRDTGELGLQRCALRASELSGPLLSIYVPSRERRVALEGLGSGREAGERPEMNRHAARENWEHEPLSAEPPTRAFRRDPVSPLSARK